MQMFEDIPKNLKDKAINISNLVGVESYVWSINDIFDLLRELEAKYPDMLLLGGDILEIDEETKQMKYSYVNWWFKGDLNKEGAERSFREAREYLEKIKDNLEKNKRYFVDLSLRGAK